MTVDIREMKGSPKKQGINEKIAYYFSTTPWGGSPSDVSAYLYEGYARVDVSSTKLTGLPSVNGDVITMPVVSGLALDEVYFLVARWTPADGNQVEAYLEIRAEH
jgi:hypothetical protein